MPRIACLICPVLALLSTMVQPTFADGQAASTAQKKVRAILAKWKDGPPQWKERMRAIVWCAKAGHSAENLLTDALRHGTHQQRLFAAEALALFAWPKSRQTLLSFLEREENSELLRVFTDKTIHQLGHVRPTSVPAQEVMRKPKKGVRRLLAWAWQHESRNGILESMRKQLVNYDLAKMDSARWCHQAPDFTLRDVSGKYWQLSDFQGEKHVVLVFIDTQT